MNDESFENLPIEAIETYELSMVRTTPTHDERKTMDSILNKVLVK
mgnify:CR=1 FL=1